MNRRDFLALWLQSLLLALFPWLRSEEGIEVASNAALAMVPQVEQIMFRGGTFNLSVRFIGWELSEAQMDFLKSLKT